MVELNRRRLLAAAGLVAAALGTGGCDTAPSGGNKRTGTLRWWDHFNPLQDLHKQVQSRYTKDTGVAVEYTNHVTAEMGKALQLARQSNQLPDIHSNAGLKLPLPALIKEGWYQPLQLDDEVLGRLPDGVLVEGVTSFGGKPYSFPLFNFRQYWAATWFNKDLVGKAGLDPGNPPKTYDEFRAATRAVKSKGGTGVYGWINNLGQPERVAEQVNFLAQAAGFGGFGGLDYKTGQYAFDSDPYLKVVEFLLSLKKDGVLVPGTSTMNDKVARARWSSGIAGFYFDGPWCAGVVVQDLKQFADKMDVGPMLVPEAGMPVTAYRGPQGGSLWLSGQSKQAEAASKLLGYLTQPDYYVGLAENMDQPPLDLGAVDRARVHPAYQKLVKWFGETVFLAPVPAVKNIEITKVQAETKDINPGLGELVSGMFSGDVTEVRKALKQLTDKNNAERERALGVATKQGAKVSLDDWAFPDWQPRTDYTVDKYKK